MDRRRPAEHLEFGQFSAFIKGIDANDMRILFPSFRHPLFLFRTNEKK